MNKRKIYSIIIALIVVIFLISGLYYFKKPVPVNINASRITLEDLKKLEYVKTDLTDERKEKYFQDFQVFKKDLEKQMSVVEKQGNQAEALLYWPLINLGNIHRDVGNYKKAEAAYLYAQKLQPGAFVPYGNLGELYFRFIKDYSKAEEYYLQAIEIPGPYLETYYSELYELYRFFLNDEKKAENILISGSVKYPEQTDILANLALHYRQLKQMPKAIETYKKLLKLYPESIVAKQALAELDK